jgi:hypothetical protein
MTEISPTPENWEVVRQAEEYQPQTVPVHVGNIVPTYALPAKRSVMRQIHVPYWGDAGATPIEMVPGDPRIKNVWIQSWGSNPGVIFLGTYEQVVKSNGMSTTDAFRYDGSAIWGPLQGFEDPLYAFASVTGQNIVSVRIEYWAD